MSEPSSLTELSWFWIGLQLTAPALAGLLVAWPFWRRREAIFGNVLGTVIIFGTGVAMILREYVELDRITKGCLEAGYVCWPDPSAFTRFALYAFIALIQVFALFTLSLKIEERIRSRDYAPEWR